jgi:hypothetical protein
VIRKAHYLVAAAAVTLLLACGGQVFETGAGDAAEEVAGDDGTTGGDDAASGDGNDGDQQEEGGGKDAGPVCPIPATIRDGVACTEPGLTCQSAAPIYTCTGAVAGFEDCTCLQGRWSCPQPTCIDASPAPPPCPLPRLVNQGFACASPGQQCPGNPRICAGSMTFNDVFQCTNVGTWNRVVATSCPDAGHATDASLGD